MKAIVLNNKQDLRLQDFPDPILQENDVLIEVKYCGICGTDVHKYNGISGSRPLTYPVPLGHEISGVVFEVGTKVNSLKKGDRVVVDPNWYCKRCEYCKDGLTHLCVNSKGVVKGMATYVSAPQENVYIMPESLSLLDACLAEPLSCCLHALKQGNVQPYTNVVVIGFGAIGKLMCALLESYNCNLIIIDIDEDKRKEVESLDAIFINSKKEDIKKKLKQQNISRLHTIIECVGLKSTIEQAIDIATKATNIVIFGVADANTETSFKPYDAFLKELTIKTSFVNPNTMNQAIEILASNKIDTNQIIQKVIPMEKAVDEFNHQKNISKGKTIVKMAL